MLELPEVSTLAKQLETAVSGRIVSQVLSPTKAHKFCWYNGDPSEYSARIAGSSLVSSEGFGIFIEMKFASGEKLCVNDGVNLRLVQAGELPRDYQLALCLENGEFLVFTVAMYGSIILHNGSYDNEYYLKSRRALSPFSPEFPEYYRRTLAESKPKLSAKAFLATEQRFPGIGNGVLQDILFDARIHPKRKLSGITEAEQEKLLATGISVLHRMAELGGRDTEKDLFGRPGGYITKMSKNTLAAGCPICCAAITKEAYLGGSVYYCPRCQPLA